MASRLNTVARNGLKAVMICELYIVLQKTSVLTSIQHYLVSI
jgi:hypothetical protein